MEDKSLDDLNWLDTDNDDLSGTPVFERPDTLSSQFLHKSVSPGKTNNSGPRPLRTYTRHSHI